MASIKLDTLILTVRIAISSAEGASWLPEDDSCHQMNGIGNSHAPELEVGRSSPMNLILANLCERRGKQVLL